MNNVKAILPGDDYVFMSRFASAEQTRYYLCGVHIESGPLLVATDGQCMGIMRLGPAQGYFSGAPFILGADKALIRACKCGAREQTIIICRDDSVSVVTLGKNIKWTAADMLEYSGDAVSFPARPLYVDGSFPEWRRVVPTLEIKPGLDRCVALNPVLLTSFARDPQHPAVSFCGTDHGSPMLVANGDPRFIGVLMPMEGSGMAELTARAKSVLGDEISDAIAKAGSL